MTTAEFDNEFDVMYDTASFGAPALNSYEKSLFLTQAIRDIIDELYSVYDSSEYSKRALNPLIVEREQILVDDSDYYNGMVVQKTTLPTELYYLLQENVESKNTCDTEVEVIPMDLDKLNKAMRNPFKKPNKRKVLRTSIGGNDVRLYSTDGLDNYKIKYLKKYTPIILTDFTTDTELVGDETIDGQNSEQNTELPVFLHDKIVKRGVILAIKSLRENNLKTQIEV